MNLEQLSPWLSIAAILIALVSLGWNVHTGWRDRAKLRVATKYQKSTAPSRDWLLVTIVNKGRRPAVARCCVVAARNGLTREDSLGAGRGEYGVRLDEHGRHEFHLTAVSLRILAGERTTVADRAWIEDNIGRKYHLPASDVRRLRNTLLEAVRQSKAKKT